MAISVFLCNQGIFLKKGLHNERLSRLLSQSSKNCVTSKKIQRLKLDFYYSDRKKGKYHSTDLPITAIPANSIHFH